jgi:hypothetical protein
VASLVDSGVLCLTECSVETSVMTSRCRKERLFCPEGITRGHGVYQVKEDSGESKAWRDNLPDKVPAEGIPSWRVDAGERIET